MGNSYTCTQGHCNGYQIGETIPIPDIGSPVYDIGETIQIIDTSISDYNIVEYIWDFGEGAIINSEPNDSTQYISYNTGGERTITLTLVDQFGTSNTFQSNVRIGVNQCNNPSACNYNPTAMDVWDQYPYISEFLCDLPNWYFPI